MRPRAVRDAGFGDDSGFTLVELIVAMVVMMVILTSMVGLLVGSLQTIGLARQRQSATALATKALEQMRALDYGTLGGGLYRADLGGDALIPDATAAAPRLVIPSAGIDELLQVNEAAVPAQVKAPVYPHRPAPTVANGMRQNGATFQVSAYVTKSTSTVNPSLNLTAMVTWTSAVSRGTKTLVQRSTAYSPAGCLSTATHPYAGPCQAYFSGQAGLTASAGFSVTNADDSSLDIPGVGGRKVELGLPSLTASMGYEQIVKLAASAQTSDAGQLSSTVTSTGGQTQSLTVDNDPSSASVSSLGPLPTDTQTYDPAQTITGPAGTFSTVPTNKDTGSAFAAISPGAAGCVDESGATYASTGQPCASANVQQQSAPLPFPQGNITVNLSGAGGITSLPTFNLATVDATDRPSRADVFRLNAPSGAACPGTSGVGCISSGAYRKVGTVTFAGLPVKSGATLPTNFPAFGFARVTNLEERALAETGLGSPRASVSSRSGGTLEYYDPTSLSVRTVALNTLVTSATYDLPPATATYPGGTGSYATITVDPSITVNPAAVPSSSSATCVNATSCAEVNGVSAVRFSALYTVALTSGASTVQLTKFVVLGDLGSLVTQASYSAAPLG